MRKKNSLKSVQTLANSAAAETSHEVARHRHALQIEEQRLAQLQTYRREYTNPDTDVQRSTGINTIRSRRGFMQRLDEAIVEQHKAVSDSLTQLEIQMSFWREARSNAMSLQKYSERVADQEDKSRAQKDQKELDSIGRHRTRR